ncbi:hypothetical protein [Candidatus Lokiarchaeum ossiferum]|uniref:hypothetical protein n=1 Tax=Candidatus Lokiarchaeum ossiferum TaxID=2951803 RepID=UPI00352CBBD6
MKIQNKKWNKLRKIMISTLILIPLIFGGFYFAFYLGILVPDLTDYMETPPETVDFYPLSVINLSRLEDIGREFELLQEQHLKMNLSQSFVKNASTGEIISYDGTDNGALHTSENLVAACYDYASLPEGKEKAQALLLVQKMLYGLRMLIEIPNGGLGPNFPGTSIGRFYTSPDQRFDGNYTWIFDEGFRHFNGTGKYSDWRIRLYTSKDELGGYFLGLAATLMLVQDVPEVQEITRLIILQAMEGFLSSFWQEMTGDGKPNGVHLQVPCYSQWKLLLTKMAMRVDPENVRYEQLFQYFLVKERKVNRTPFVNKMDNIDNYYSQYFENMVVLGLFLVEDDPRLVDLYFQNFQAKTYSSYRGHRNGFLNAVYLTAVSLSQKQASFKVDDIRWDILDQLWRFNEFNLVPLDTTCGGRNQTIARSELGGDWTTIDPNIAKWKDFVDNTAFGSTYQWLTYGLQDAIFRERYLKPATIEMMNPTTSSWNRNPYQEDGVNIFNTTSTIRQYAGAAYTLPYYMLKYYGYLEGY